MIRLFGTDCHDCEKFKDNVPCYDDYRFCEKSLAEHNSKIRADVIDEVQNKLTDQWLLENLASADDTKTIRRIIVERLEQLKS